MSLLRHLQTFVHGFWHEEGQDADEAPVSDCADEMLAGVKTSLFTSSIAERETSFAEVITSHVAMCQRCTNDAAEQDEALAGYTGPGKKLRPIVNNLEAERKCLPGEDALFAPMVSPLAVSRSSVGPYYARQGDPTDVLLAQFFQQNPMVYARNSSIARMQPDTYMLHGRTIRITRQTSSPVGDASQLVVQDGPLTQPLVEYLQNRDDSAEYTLQVETAIQAIPQEARMTFYDTGATYSSRYEAMQIAREQAIVREKAAVMLNKGRLPAEDLFAEYEAQIDMKLGKNRSLDQTSSFAELHFDHGFASSTSHMHCSQEESFRLRFIQPPISAGGA